MGAGRGILGLLLALGAAAILASGLGGGTSAAQSEPIPVVDCQTRIQVKGDASPGPRSVTIGPVAFNELKLWRKIKRRDLRPHGRRWTGVKSPFFIKTGEAPATVIIDGFAEGSARVNVGLDTGGAAVGPAVKISPCSAGYKGRSWTIFLAGFDVKGPMCLRVSVQVDGQPTPIGPRKVTIGKHSCRGK